MPLIVCTGNESSRPRTRRTIGKPDGNVLVLAPLGAESARLKQPSIRTASYIVGSERWPARASLFFFFLINEKNEKNFLISLVA